MRMFLDGVLKGVKQCLEQINRYLLLPLDPSNPKFPPLVYDDDDDNTILHLMEYSDPCAPGYLGIESYIDQLLQQNRNVKQLLVR